MLCISNDFGIWQNIAVSFLIVECYLWFFYNWFCTKILRTLLILYSIKNPDVVWKALLCACLVVIPAFEQDKANAVFWIIKKWSSSPHMKFCLHSNFSTPDQFWETLTKVLLSRNDSSLSDRQLIWKVPFHLLFISKVLRHYALFWNFFFMFLMYIFTQGHFSGMGPLIEVKVLILVQLTRVSFFFQEIHEFTVVC